VKEYEAILAAVLALLQEETGTHGCGASPQRWDKGSLDNTTTMLKTCLSSIAYKELSWGTGWTCARMLAEAQYRKSQTDSSRRQQREIELLGEIIGHGDRGGDGLREKAAVGPQGTEVHGKAAPIRIAPTPHDFLLITG
jgi:hypothetical protein